MTNDLRTYLLGISACQLTNLEGNTRMTLRKAWPHRHTARGRLVVTANVTMLRNLRAL